MSHVPIISRLLFPGSDSTSMAANGSGWSENYTCILLKISMKNFSKILQRWCPISMASCSFLHSQKHGFIICIRNVHVVKPLFHSTNYFIDRSNPLYISHFPPASLSFFRDVNNVVNDILNIAGVPATDRNSLVRCLLNFGREHEEISSTTLIPLFVNFNVTTVLRNEAEAVDWLCKGTMDSEIVRTLRATGDAILKLETKSFDGSSSKLESCMVCLEGFENGESVSRLLCSHKFHYGCIEEWLCCNHRCPVCRFPMPWVASASIGEDSTTPSYDEEKNS